MDSGQTKKISIETSDTYKKLQRFCTGVNGNSELWCVSTFPLQVKEVIVWQSFEFLDPTWLPTVCLLCWQGFLTKAP